VPFKEKTIEDVLDRLGRLESRDFILLVWADDKGCKPVVKAVRLTLPKKISQSAARNIILGINSKVWILSIIDEHKNLYVVTSSTDFAKKTCEEKEREKGKENA